MRPRAPIVVVLADLAPRDGRAARADARPSDLTHWRTVLAADVTRAARVLAPGRDAPASPGTLSLRDPDGHAVELAHPPHRAASGS